MKIDISLNSIDELMRILRKFGWGPCGSADRPTGWVSHPVADLSKQPPSFMSVATTGNGHGGGAEDGETAHESHETGGDMQACSELLRDVTGLLSRLEGWAATCRVATLPEVFSFARVEQGYLHVHASMPSFQPDGLTLYDNMLDLPDEAGRKDTFNLIADGIAHSIGIKFGADMMASFSDHVNGHPSDGQA